MSHAHETAGQDEHEANHQDGTDDEYGPLSDPPDETTPGRRHQQLGHEQATRQRHPPRHHRHRPHIPRQTDGRTFDVSKQERASGRGSGEEKKGIASFRSRSNIDDSEINSKQERQGSESAASVSVPRRKGEWIGYEAIAMTPSTSSPRPVHLIAGASRHPSRNRTRPASVIALSLSIDPGFYSSTLRPPSFIRYSSPSRFSSRSISSRRASRSYIGLLAHAVFVMPPRRVLLVGPYSHPSHHPAVEHGIAIAPSALLYIPIASLYPCIFISFIYIAYIIFIIYIHQRGMINPTPIIQASSHRLASRLASSNRASDMRQ